MRERPSSRGQTPASIRRGTLTLVALSFALYVAAGCGRIGYDPLSEDASAPVDAGPYCMGIPATDCAVDCCLGELTFTVDSDSLTDPVTIAVSASTSFSTRCPTDIIVNGPTGPVADQAPVTYVRSEMPALDALLTCLDTYGMPELSASYAISSTMGFRSEYAYLPPPPGGHTDRVEIAAPTLTSTPSDMPPLLSAHVFFAWRLYRRIE
jgi:hypothetical protein